MQLNVRLVGNAERNSLLINRILLKVESMQFQMRTLHRCTNQRENYRQSLIAIV